MKQAFITPEEEKAVAEQVEPVMLPFFKATSQMADETKRREDININLMFACAISLKRIADALDRQ